MDLPKRIYHGPEVQRLYRDLLAAEVAAGGAVNYAAPVGLTVGGSNVEGVSDDVARADHKHALPAFGTTAGTFAEGNDLRFDAAGPWDGRVVPTTSPAPHADSDEFTTGSLNAAWLDWDHGGWVTHTVESPPDQLVSTGTGNGTLRRAGRYKAVPVSTGGEMQFIAYVAFDCSPVGVGSASGVFAGLAMFADATNSASAFVAWEILDNNPTTGSAWRLLQQASHTNYTTGSGSPITTPTKHSVGIWLRIRATLGATTNLFCDWSYDGVRWQTGSGGTWSVGYEPQHYGIIGSCNTSSAFRTTHSYFRTWTGTGAYGHNYALNGGRLR